MRLQAVVTNSCILLIQVTSALRYDPEQVGFNLNENETARDPMDYWGEWQNHSYYPSPDNWRIPFYTLFIDRFVNGDPANDDANGTQFEHDLLSNQLRHGGDVRGLMDSFDYIQGIGVKVDSAHDMYFEGAGSDLHRLSTLLACRISICLGDQTDFHPLI